MNEGWLPVLTPPEVHVRFGYRMTTVDLRSDTFTLPTPPMLEAMMRAEVGDDVWGEDPTVRALEAQAADRFGHEAALFCSSGTMTNQIALRVHLRPGDEVICAPEAHIYNYEGGGIAANAGASVRLPAADRGRFTARSAAACIRPDDPHHPCTRLIAVEDTCNQGGGSVWRRAELLAMRELCDSAKLGLHLDGARVFNRLVATGDDPRVYGRTFDSISMCLSKGLGAPVGSVLIGSRPFIDQARRVRKRMGGGMRQAGYLAAAGLYALENHVDRLADDHRRARRLAEILEHSPKIDSVLPVETNIVIFAPNPNLGVTACLAHLEAASIRATGMNDRIRFVTHLGVDDAGIETVVRALERL